MPRQFISFHYSEEESNELKERAKLEGLRTTQTFPRGVKQKLLLLKKQRLLRQKKLALLQVAEAKESISREKEDINEERVNIGSQECLMSSSDEGSEGLEKFLRDKLALLSGEGLDRIVEVDPTIVLELLDENLVDRGSTGSNVVPVDKEKPRNCGNDILRSDVKEKRVGCVSKWSLCGFGCWRMCF